MGYLLSLLFRFLFLLLFYFPSSISFASSSPNFLCHPDHSFALLQFKASFTINSYYLKIERWENGTDCCSWDGVTCDSISGYVIGLDLSCAALQGTIHPNSTLFHLSHPQTLNLAFNYFYPTQLSSQFGGFVSLTHLNLSQAGFEGEIPSQISHLSKLVSLDLSRNYFDHDYGEHKSLKWKETSWRKLVQNATGLRELVLDHTNMSSISISSSILNLSSSLVTLSLSMTGLSGNLTDGIFCLPNLQMLSLSGNHNLQGPLPKLNCHAAISVLDLSYCEFQGSIPPSFSNLTRLTSLSLFSNALHGSIPSSLLTLPQLTSLDLSWNYLSGQIPDVFSPSNSFQELDLRDNNIGGELPPSLSNLQHLIRLDLSANKLSGQIPSSLFELTHLSYLDLSWNDLNGQIPSSLFELTHLSYLGCSSNKLEGPLPNKITGFSNLNVLWFDNNLLNGTIPPWCLSLPSLVVLGLSNNQFTGHITTSISSYSLESLYLCGNKLHGNVPESIFNLVNLTELCLSSNNLSGPFNFQLSSKLQNLKYLSLSHNSQLSLDFQSKVNYTFSRLQALELSSLNVNEFPKLLGKLPSLDYLNLSNNKLNGRVPNWLTTSPHSRNYNLWILDLSFNSLGGKISSSICNASSLGILNLSHNKLTGIIPQCLGNLSNLFVLDLQMNKLHGTLPSTFSQYTFLTTLNFNGNQLEGPLPKSLSNCISLQFLDLGNNQIKDTFPHWLQTLPYLEVLVLRANKLHGPITGLKVKNPFPSLKNFDISYNNFSGQIPKAYIKNFEAMKNVVRDEVDNELSYMEQGMDYGTYTDSVTLTMKENSITFPKIPTIFVHVDLSKNMFEGEIPNVIGELHALKGLNLSHNRLIGPILPSMGNLTNLESLDLSSNMLTGGIPTELTNLNYLEVLNLSHNHLVGEIPQGKQFNTFSNDSYEGNIGLCGFPLTMTCNPEQHSPPSTTLWSEEKFGFDWKPVAIGYGCGMVFGVGLGYCVLLTGKPQWLVRMVGGRPNKRIKRRTRMRTRAGRMNRLVQMS